MSNYGKLRVAELDFDAIKQNIRTFLKQYPGFTDYDFEGSALSVLIDALAYNTHYLAFYVNMLSSEMFLDSAALRQSIVSHAKHLNYIPTSRKAATAIVNVTIDPSPDTPASLTIAKGHTFVTALDGDDYTFVTTEAHNIIPVSGVYSISGLEIIQGEWFTYQSTVDNTIPKQRFIIPDANVDISTVSVKVQTSSTVTTQESYILSSDFNTLTPTSKVFFIQESEDGRYEVYFGDNVLGYKPVDGNIVIVEYVVTDGLDANKAGGGSTASGRFSSGTTIGGYGNIVVTTTTAAFGGAEREDVEHIRFAAPKNYEAQNRAVTVGDYKTIVTRDYPNAESVAVWGGENNEPPTYGKVFISIKPVEGSTLTETTKKYIKDTILKQYNIVSLIPEIVDPEYIYLLIDSTVKYDSNISIYTEGDLRDVVFAAISGFADQNVDQFDRVFKYSRLLSAIDSSDTSITSNITGVRMRKNFEPRLNIEDQYTIQFHNAIYPGTLTSSKFIVSGDPMINYFPGDEYYFDDDQSGNIRIYKIANSQKVFMKTESGTINYDTGEVIITDFIPSSLFDSPYISLTVRPLNTDVIPKRNDVIVINDSDISITMQVDNPVIT
jgi:hypothetical protein